MKNILLLNFYSLNKDYKYIDNTSKKAILEDTTEETGLYNILQYIDGVIKYCKSDIKIDVIIEYIGKYIFESLIKEKKNTDDEIYEFIEYEQILQIIDNYNLNKSLINELNLSKIEIEIYQRLYKLFEKSNYEIILIPVWFINVKFCLISVLLNKIFKNKTKLILGGPAIETSNHIKNLFKYYNCIISTDNIESVIYRIINNNLNVDEIGHEFEETTEGYLPIYNDEHLNFINSNIVSVGLSKNCKFKCKFCQGGNFPFRRLTDNQIEQILLYYKSKNLNIWFNDSSIIYVLDVVSKVLKNYDNLLYFFIELDNFFKNEIKFKNFNQFALQIGLEELSNENCVSNIKKNNNIINSIKYLSKLNNLKYISCNTILKLPNVNKTITKVQNKIIYELCNIDENKIMLFDCHFLLLPNTEYYNNHDKYNLKFNYIEDFPKSFDNELINILSKIPITYNNLVKIDNYELLYKIRKEIISKNNGYI